MKRIYLAAGISAVLLSVPVAFADTMPVPTPEAANVDIMGIHLGQSPDEVKRAMEATVAGIQVDVVEATWPDGTRYVSRISGKWGIPNKNNPTVVSRGEMLTVAFSAAPSGNKSFWISRQAAYFDGNEVSKDATIQALLSKYGKRSDSGRTANEYTWAYGNLNGYADPEQYWKSFGQCKNDNFNSNCPDVHITVDVSPALVPTLVTSLTFVLKDNKYGLASLRYDQQMRAAAQKIAEEKAGKLAAAPRL